VDTTGWWPASSVPVPHQMPIRPRNSTVASSAPAGCRLRNSG
jgi:hypothetical protein